MTWDDDEECTCPDCQPPVYRSRPQQASAAKLVYVCHPFAGDAVGNAERVRRICEQLKDACVPLAPQLLLPAYFDEATERDMALRHCLRLVAACDEVRVYGADVTAGMRMEIVEARRLGVPVVFADDGTRKNDLSEASLESEE